VTLERINSIVCHQKRRTLAEGRAAKEKRKKTNELFLKIDLGAGHADLLPGFKYSYTFS
jgi:hypothetical protein